MKNVLTEMKELVQDRGQPEKVGTISHKNSDGGYTVTLSTGATETCFTDNTVDIGDRVMIQGKRILSRLKESTAQTFYIK